MTSPKIWVSMMVHNQRANIENLCKNLDWCDGIVATDHYSDDGTYEILEQNKKEGIILRMPWMDLHYLSMTANLQCGVIRPGDWVFALDSQEVPHPKFASELRDNIKKWQANGIGCVFWGKPLLFRKHPEMVYTGNPHCFPSPLIGKVINIEDTSKIILGDNIAHFGDVLISNKLFDNTMIFHGSKYYFYSISNQPQMFYEKYGADVLKHHNELRLKFLLYLESVIKEKPTIYKYLNLIEKYINKSEPPDNFILSYTDFEFPLTDAIRLKILKQDRDFILKNRYNWSLRNLLETGDAIQENTSYKGTITRYEESIDNKI